MEQWISVRHWRRFQHYDPAKRQPPWIKVYTELMSDDAYLQLRAGPRSVLHGIWLEYASSLCQLRFDTVSLTRRLNLRVTSHHLKSLVDAGFIDVVASKTLADGYHLASARAHDVEEEAEVEEEPETQGQEQEQQQVPEKLALDIAREDQHLNGNEPAAAEDQHPPNDLDVEAYGRTLPGWDDGSLQNVLPLARQLTAAEFKTVTLKHADRIYAGHGKVRNQTGLLIDLLEAAIATRHGDASRAHAAAAAERTPADELASYARNYARSQTPWEAAEELLKLKLRREAPDDDHRQLLEVAHAAYEDELDPEPTVKEHA